MVRDDPGVLGSKMGICSFTGTYDMIGMWRVTEGMWRDPHPEVGYHLEVKAFGEWTSAVFQPDLGQCKGNFPYRAGLDGGATVVGPFRTSPRPARANIQHSGNGAFRLQFISLDGMHEPEVLACEGQIHLEEQELDLLPGKEYLMLGWGNGPWKVELTEGY